MIIFTGLAELVQESIRAVEGAGVLHNDLRDANMLWNEEVKGVVIVDFERSRIREAGLAEGMRLEAKENGMTAQMGYGERPLSTKENGEVVNRKRGYIDAGEEDGKVRKKRNGCEGLGKENGQGDAG